MEVSGVSSAMSSGVPEKCFLLIKNSGFFFFNFFRAALTVDTCFPFNTDRNMFIFKNVTNKSYLLFFFFC